MTLIIHMYYVNCSKNLKNNLKQHFIIITQGIK